MKMFTSTKTIDFAAYSLELQAKNKNIDIHLFQSNVEDFIKTILNTRIYIDIKSFAFFNKLNFYYLLYYSYLLYTYNGNKSVKFDLKILNQNMAEHFNILKRKFFDKISKLNKEERDYYRIHILSEKILDLEYNNIDIGDHLTNNFESIEDIGIDLLTEISEDSEKYQKETSFFYAKDKENINSFFNFGNEVNN